MIEIIVRIIVDGPHVALIVSILEKEKTIPPVEQEYIN